MCGMVTTALAVVGSALTIASSIQSGAAAKEQSQYQADMARRDADLRQEEADRIRTKTAEQETLLRQEQATELGAQRSLLASQGYSLGDMDGSAAKYLTQTSGQNEEEALHLREQGEYQAWQKENAVHEAQSRAEQHEIKGAKSKTASLLNAGKSVADSWYSYV